MENVSKLMTIGFSAIVFATALVMTIMMYMGVNEFMEQVEGYRSYKSVMVGD